MFEVNPDLEITAITDIGPEDRSAIVIDNFYANPDEVRNLALKLPREKNIPFALYKNSVDFIEGYNDWSIRFKQLKEYARNEGAPKSFLDYLHIA